MKNRKWTQCRRLRLCSSLMCILGLALIGPAAVRAGGPRMQPQRRAMPYVARVPSYHAPVGGVYNSNVRNVPVNRSALTGISTQRGVMVLPPNTNQPAIHQLKPPTSTRAPLQVVAPQGTVMVVPTPGVTSKAYPCTAASNKTRDTTPSGVTWTSYAGAAAASTKTRDTAPSGPVYTQSQSLTGVSAKPRYFSPASSQLQSPGSGPKTAYISMGSSQVQSSRNPVGGGSGAAIGSNRSIGLDPTEQFQQNRRIQGSDQWDGSNYQTLRNYRTEWHDRDWWRSHYSRIVFGAGGWYYWKAGYWYPAWGYDPDAHYAYDGPIYAYNDLPPDQVVASAQAALRPQGYYKAEPDGLLGSNTRAAIVNYQRDHGLYATSTVDQPTSQSLGMR